MQIYQQGDYRLVLEPALCKGCNLCVYSCPTGILHLNARGKIATTPEAVAEKCIFCRICEMRCPDFAIWVVKPIHSEVEADLRVCPHSADLPGCPHEVNHASATADSG